MKVNILGVQIDNLNKADVLDKVEKFLSDDRQHYIVTPNPEIVVAAQSDKEFLGIINRADLAVPDGVGLIFASRYLKRPLPEKIHGVDLMVDLCRLAEQKNYSIYLLGGGEGIAKRAAEKLKEKFPGLRMAGAESGGIITDQKLTVNNQVINFAKPDILFVAFGAGKQEKWIAKNLENISSIKIAMGVGGAFDFIAGKIKRAPKWMRKIGLEWLWRLFMQPWRWKRILTATIKFSWKVIKNGKKYA
ncbi:MAG: WecB/TagA/CpsF family glycosyltransferase [Patescibacteria group bacterium]